jgi:hypothetical protein
VDLKRTGRGWAGRLFRNQTGFPRVRSTRFFSFKDAEEDLVKWLVQPIEGQIVSTETSSFCEAEGRKALKADGE